MQRKEILSLKTMGPVSLSIDQNEAERRKEQILFGLEKRLLQLDNDRFQEPVEKDVDV